jgi:GxxExxY protein
MLMERLFEPESRETIGCAREVHRELGPGFLESVYHHAVTVSLVTEGIPLESGLRVGLFMNFNTPG